MSPTVRARVGHLLARRHLEPADDTAPADPLAETSPVLAALVGASVQGRVALGPRAGDRILRDLHVLLHARFGVDHTTIQVEHDAPPLVQITAPPRRQ